MREPDFEISADMRLLELQRGALGLPARDRHAWESRAVSEGSIPIEPREPEPGQSAVLNVEATAYPADGVIPGAVVTLGLSVANEGAVLASEVVVGAPLPGGATYRPGTFGWNGRSTYDDVAETFFGTGLAIGALGPGDRATFSWKIGVRIGAKPLVIAPMVRASKTAVVGARPVVIGRKEGVAGAFTGELGKADSAIYEPKPLIPVEIPVTELPIYELDEEEQLVYEASDAALSSAAPKLPEPAATSPAEVEAVPLPEVAPPAEAPPEEEAPPQPEAPPPAAVEPPRIEIAPERKAVVLYGRFDRATIAFFERVFDGPKPPTILQHCIFGGALACSLDPAGTDPAGLKRHLDAQSQVLHRIVLHERLGKKEPIAEYAGELLAELDRLQPEPAASSARTASKDALTLVTELSEPTRTVLQRIAEERARWDFVKARQLTLALQAQTVADERIDAALRGQIESVLRSYAQASVTVLQKLFVRIRIDRSTGLLFQTEPGMDSAAKAAIAAFKRALG